MFRVAAIASSDANLPDRAKGRIVLETGVAARRQPGRHHLQNAAGQADALSRAIDRARLSHLVQRIFDHVQRGPHRQELFDIGFGEKKSHFKIH